MVLSLMQHVLGGKVEKAPVREYGKDTDVAVNTSSAFVQRGFMKRLVVLDEPF